MTRNSVADPWWFPFATVDAATVVRVDLAPHAAREAAALAWLDQEEQSRWQRFQHPGPRRRFALCRASLRAILCDRLDCLNAQLAFGVSDYGKPFALVQGLPVSISFNVAHSGNHGLIAFAPTGRLGVDIEERVTRRDLDRLIMTVLGPAEQAELSSLDGKRKLNLFLTLWTLKEALIKALGVGFSLDISRFEVPSDILRGTRTSMFQFPHLPTVNWRVDNLGNERFAAAIAQEMGQIPNRERPANR